jgi:beta-glucosidase
MRLFRTLCAVALLQLCAVAQPIQPWQNWTLPVSQRVSNLLSLLTLPEKLSLLFSTSAAVPRVGLPGYAWGTECLHGVKIDATGEGATIFPQPIALAATFNTSLLHSIGVAVSDEARAVRRVGVL